MLMQGHLTALAVSELEEGMRERDRLQIFLMENMRHAAYPLNRLMS